MNLGKLLVAGKSIINGRAQVLYRANKHIYLPRFGPAQNPFQPAAGTEAPAPKSDTAAAPAKRTAPPMPAKTQKLPPWSPGPARTTSWASKLNPISIWREAHPAKDTPPPVQSELSLDSVKVVHNDLSDADVEVVPMKSRPADRAAARAAIPELPPPSRPWEFLAERMFHATRE